MTLGSLIHRHARDRVLIQSKSGSWTVSRVLSGTTELSRSFCGARVAVRTLDPGLGLRTLCVLDGVAESIILIPSSIPPTALPNILYIANCDFVIDDNPESLSAYGIENVFSKLDDALSFFTPRLRCDATKWILSTSGTTGSPKLVGHTLASLLRTTKLNSNQGAEIRWGLLYEFSRFAGLQVMLQSVVSGSILICPPIEAAIEDKVKVLSQWLCTHISATPTMWRKIVMTPGAELLPLRQVTLGGEISDERLLASLSAIYPQARVTHIYASTEAGVGFSVNDRRAGFPASFLSQPPAGILLRVTNNRLHVRNELVSPKYIGGAESFGSDEGWIDTGDDVEIRGDRVYFLGRYSGQINVGGNKVHPEEVEAVLQMHPQVEFVKVYGKSNPITGALVAADVKLSSEPEDPRAFRRELQEFASSKLEKFKVPALITFVSSIHANSAGKLARGES